MRPRHLIVWSTSDRKCGAPYFTIHDYALENWSNTSYSWSHNSLNNALHYAINGGRFAINVTENAIF